MENRDNVTLFGRGKRKKRVFGVEKREKLLASNLKTLLSEYTSLVEEIRYFPCCVSTENKSFASRC